MAEIASRDGEARAAAEALLQFGGSQSMQQSNVHNYGTTSNASDTNARRSSRKVCCGLMSDVRRTFCLGVTFDLILTFVLWGIFVKLKVVSNLNTTSPMCNMSSSMSQRYCDEILNFSMENSLFDIVICGTVRFLLLVFAYGLFRLQNPSVIAVTTFFTSLYVIVKVFWFGKYGEDPPSYLLLISSFIVAWLETWFLDFRVLPKERASSLRVIEAGGHSSERASLLGGRSASEHIDSDFGTPACGSDDDNDDDEGRAEPRGYSSINSEYRKRADDGWKIAWQLLNLPGGWKRESGSENIIVHSQEFRNLGKVFRLEAVIDASTDQVFQITTMRCPEIPSWNPTVMECKILQSLGKSMDILYSVTAPAGKGMVSSRDFVTARQWKQTETGEILAAGAAVEHYLMPIQTQHVRGENRVSGWLFQTFPNNPNQCLLRMVVGTDIKGWIPQVVVDQALTGVLVDSIRHLRSYISRSQ